MKIVMYALLVVLLFSNLSQANMPIPAPDPYYLDIKKIVVFSNVPSSGLRPVTFPNDFNVELAYKTYDNLDEKFQEKLGASIDVLAEESLKSYIKELPNDVLIIKFSGTLDYDTTANIAIGGISVGFYRNDSAFASSASKGLRRFNMNSSGPCVFQGATDKEFANNANKCSESLVSYIAKRINKY